MNRLDTTRMVCSRVNENARLNSLPKERSATLAIQFSSDDPNLSPQLDTSGISSVLAAKVTRSLIMLLSLPERTHH